LTQHIRLKFYDSFFQANIDETLKINLHYLTIPLSLNYSIPFNSNSSLLFSGSVEAGVLLSQNDNYQDIILYEIGLPKKVNSKVVFTPGLSAAYLTKVKNCGIVELGFYISRDMTPWISDNFLWGFYHNLH